LGELIPKIEEDLAKVAEAWKAAYPINHIATFSLRAKPDINRRTMRTSKTGAEATKEAGKREWRFGKTSFFQPTD
jgi:hypothetical protein